MRIACPLFVLALLCGCASSHTRIDTGPAVRGTQGAGTSVSGGGVSVEYPSGSAAPGIVVLTVLGLWFYGEAAAGLVAIQSDSPGRQAPAMDPRRTVNEQDCTKPIEVPTANLRCR